MTKDPFDFPEWITESVAEASINVVKKAMKTLEKIGESLVVASATKHSFYISFITQDKEAVLPDFLKETYPEAITIVLENQFENLSVKEKGFYVSLSFNGKMHNIYVPFKAIINFSDKALNLSIPIIYDSKRLAKGVVKNKKSKSPFKVSAKSNIIEFKLD